MGNILLIGATSAVAEGVALRFAEQGHQLYCLGRNADKLETVATRLGDACVGSFAYDFTDTASTPEVIETAVNTLGSIDIAFIAHGYLPDQIETEHSYELAKKTIEINYLSAVAMLIPITEQMQAQGHGKIGVITSVAGDRGRPRNYTYGSAKGALALYLQGVRSVLWDQNIEVYTFKMGPVDTPMTVNHDKNFSFSTVDHVAEKMVNAFQKKQYQLYVPSFWKGIMFAVRNMPETIYQKIDFLSGR